MSPILLMTADTGVIFTTTVVIAGISIVVGVLILLILVFEIFGKIVPSIDRRATEKAKKKAAKKVAKSAKNSDKPKVNTKPEKNKPAINKAPVSVKPAISKPPVQPVVEDGISGEIVAAIAAAVVATEGNGAVIRSIKKKNVGGRNPWAQAANIDNTRPF